MRGDDTARQVTGNLGPRAHARDSTIEVVVVGNLDMAAGLQLETQVDALLAAKHAQTVQLDLAQVGFVDSAGLGALLAVRDRAIQLGIDVAITHVPDRVRRILDLTGLADIADR